MRRVNPKFLVLRKPPLDSGSRGTYNDARECPAVGSEAELIERIRRGLPSDARRARRAGVRLGIGDDAALARSSGTREWVLTGDMFLENIHFLAAVHPPEAVGYKALARATSDIAAMGAVPKFFLLMLALPADRTGAWLNAFLRGMARAARQFGLALAGGDTTKHSSVAASITVVGEAPRGRAVLRSCAKPGDLLCVSGTLGAAQLGLELVLRGLHRDARWRPLLRPHLSPPLRLALGQWLAAKRFASAMIDISDGLSTDLAHICRASVVGARVWADRLPLVGVPSGLAARGFDPLELALHGGEDYELLFTVARRSARRLPRSFRGVRITVIGEIVRGRGVTLVAAEGRMSSLTARGWDPFRHSGRLNPD